MNHDEYLKAARSPSHNKSEIFKGCCYTSMNSNNFLKCIINAKPGDIVRQTTRESYLIEYKEDKDDDYDEDKGDKEEKINVTFDFEFVFEYDKGFTGFRYSNLDSDKKMPDNFYVDVHDFLSFEYWHDLEHFLFDVIEIFPHLW